MAIDEVRELSAARARVLEAIAEAAARVGRDPASVEVIAVTKTVPHGRIRAAAAAGFATFGENRVQERQAKAEDVANLRANEGRAVAWHLIGPLQSNKARRAVELFDVIQAVDSPALATRLDRIAGDLRPGARLPVLLQVNVDADPSKAGFDPAAVERELPAILDLANLEVRGLMTVGRLVQDPEQARPTFVALRALSERLRGAYPGLGGALSMGMTDDFPVAVEEGATLVRIGRAIFGERH